MFSFSWREMSKKVPFDYHQLQQHFRPTVARAFWLLREFSGALIASFGRELAKYREAALTSHALATFATRY